MSSKFQLPRLEPYRRELEKCVYCPKLCRASCPVSNVEGRESVTPWGKMSLAYFAARSDVAFDAEQAELAWACSGCLGCRERCEHDNPVATVLATVRAEAFERGVAPLEAVRVAQGHAARSAAASEELARMGLAPELAAHRAEARIGLLIGCGYIRRLPDVAASIAQVVRHLVDEPLRIVDACCGLPLLLAGDSAGQERAEAAFAEQTAGLSRLVVADPGCAHALIDGPLAGRVGEVIPLVDLVYGALERLEAGHHAGRVFRYHDPCQLGRGLHRYDEPRAILARLTGTPPLEFQRNRGDADCSGGGGLLPVVRPAASRSIADARIAEHHDAGGGTIVTACAQSILRFRSQGADAVDIMSLVAAALAIQDEPCGG